MIIKHVKSTYLDDKRILFKDIISSYIPNDEMKMRKEAHKKYQHPFIVQADGKLFELYSNTTDERLMWLSGFSYIIKTN
jgi:hypothetical protein